MAAVGSQARLIHPEDALVSSAQLQKTVTVEPFYRFSSMAQEKSLVQPQDRRLAPCSSRLATCGCIFRSIYKMFTSLVGISSWEL